MNTQNETEQEPVETEGSPYVPSARPSIHQHSTREMGHYGLKTRQVKKASPSSRHQGTDEVDNIMSKHVRQTSPVPVTIKKNQTKCRRNSFNVSDQECTDDESDRDEFSHQSLSSDFLKAHNSSLKSEKITKTHTQKNDEYNNHISFDSVNEDCSVNQSMQENAKSGIQVMLLLIGVVSTVAALYFNNVTDIFQGKECIHYYDKVEFRKDMNNLGEKYKINDDSILEVQSGISTILERNDTGSFIFVYNGKSVDFDFKQFSNFVEDIAATSARYLRNDSASVQPTVIYSSELTMQSHSELMNEYRREVAKTGVMLVKDVDRIPSSLAMAFHYFCDEYNPLVAKSAIFFTLNLEKCSNISDQKSTHNEIEKCLANKWHLVPKDNIKPLLARVVNVVIDVTKA